MKRFLILMWLLLIPAAALAQSQPLCKAGTGWVPCAQPLLQAYIPSSIPATKIGSGTVSDTAFGYLSGLTQNIQTTMTSLQAQITAQPALSSTTPAAVGTAAVGVGTTTARGDHVHALPTVGPGAGATAYPSSITTDAQGRITATSAGGAPAPASRLVSTGSGLQGGGDLSADRTLSVDSTVATLTGAQTLTNKTVSGPSISSPSFSGTESGTRTIGGVPTLGANLAAGGYKVTGLGAPTAGSADAATALSSETAAAAAKTGGQVVLATLARFANWPTGYYVGPLGIVEGAIVTAIAIPWVAPCPGVLRKFAVQNLPFSTTGITYTFYQATVGPGSYSTTGVSVSIGGNVYGSNASGSIAVAAGDCILTSGAGAGSSMGSMITALFIPDVP